jgi:hypothetical protein
MAFEEEFNVEIPDDAAEKIQTVGDAINFINTQMLNNNLLHSISNVTHFLFLT